MKVHTFIKHLNEVGFIQNTPPKAQNWYENFINGKSVFVGIMENETDYMGHCLIMVNTYDENSDEEIEKEYISCDTAWRAIRRMLE